MSELLVSKLDYKNATDDEIKAEIKRLESLSGDANDEQMAIKEFINSVYGGMGATFFVGFKKEMAESITLQGQTFAKLTKSVIDKYFREYWHRDKKVHQKFGINKVNRINKDVVVYGDTDSNYVEFGSVFKSMDKKFLDWKENINFLKGFYDFRLKNILNDAYDKYSINSGCVKNLQNLELEKISHTGLIMAKKTYILDIAWQEPNIFYNRGEHITYTGVEIIRGDSPDFVRNKLKESVVYIFKNADNFNINEFINRLKKLKSEFALIDVENISKSTGITDYEKYILDDKQSLKIAGKCPVHTKGAGYHNYLLYNSDYKTKYNFIKSGDKVKWYYSKDKFGKTFPFSFIYGDYPYEFAPSVDIDTQFEKLVINPLNRILTTAKFGVLNPRLVTKTKLF